MQAQLAPIEMDSVGREAIKVSPRPAQVRLDRMGGIMVFPLIYYISNLLGYAPKLCQNARMCNPSLPELVFPLVRNYQWTPSPQICASRTHDSSVCNLRKSSPAAILGCFDV